MNGRKIFFAGMMMTLLSSVAAAKSEAVWYARNIYQYTNSNGIAYEVEALTRTPDQGVCESVIRKKGVPYGKFAVSSAECVPRSKFVDVGGKDPYQPIFSNQAVLGYYLAFRDKNKFEVRVRVNTLGGANVPMDLTEAEAVLVLRAFALQMKNLGIEHIKILHPRN